MPTLKCEISTRESADMGNVYSFTQRRRKFGMVYVNSSGHHVALETRILSLAISIVYFLFIWHERRTNYVNIVNTLIMI